MYVATTTPVEPLRITLTAEQQLAAHYVRVADELASVHGRDFAFEEINELIATSGAQFYRNHHLELFKQTGNRNKLMVATSFVSIADAIETWTLGQCYQTVQMLFELTRP